MFKINSLGIFLVLLMGCLMTDQTEGVDEVDRTMPSPRDISQGDYLISTAVMTQYEATAYCYNNNLRQLASIESMVENLEVTNFVQNTPFGGFGWTSGSSVDWIDRSYKWLSTNEMILFSNFESEIPEMGFAWGEWKMMGIILGNGSYWHLERKLNLHHAICEK